MESQPHRIEYICRECTFKDMKRCYAHCQNRLVTYENEIRHALIKHIHYGTHHSVFNCECI